MNKTNCFLKKISFNLRKYLPNNRLNGICFRGISDNNCGHPLRIAVIGSGPSGFYITQQLLKNPRILVDIYEKYPVPFGLVRFGVAPDHQTVKNVINSFTNTALNKRVSFIGNVSIGSDLSLQNIRDQYNAVVLCYGAAQDRTLNIEGEELPNVISARRFVGWYNGVPNDKQLDINLDSETAVIIGHGNVAIDCARILLSNSQHISNTDITKHSLEKLIKSRVKNVYIIGRRGPLQVSFTIKEFRELTKLEDCVTIISPEDCKHISKTFLESLDRPKRRLTELIVKISEESVKNLDTSYKKCFIKFLRTPRFIKGDQTDGVSAVVLSVNKFESEDKSLNRNANVVTTQTLETLECGLVLRSIGYKAILIDNSLPFDDKNGTILNKNGRVIGCGAGLYCSGWAATGAQGVILNTMNTSIEVAKNILEDIETNKLDLSEKYGNENIVKNLKSKGLKIIHFNDWKQIDRMEQQLGSALGKPREKIVDINHMIDIIEKDLK